MSRHLQKGLYRTGLTLLVVVKMLVIHGCASTEELYAEYDARLCEIVVHKTEKGKTVIKEVESQEVAVWEPAVFFDYDSYDLKPASIVALNTDIGVLKTYPELRVAVRGSTDSRGNDAYNLALSQRRVDVVIQYLVSKGIDKSRFSGRAYGARIANALPLAEQAHAVNRRTELLILDEKGDQLTDGLEKGFIRTTTKRVSVTE